VPGGLPRATEGAEAASVTLAGEGVRLGPSQPAPGSDIRCDREAHVLPRSRALDNQGRQEVKGKPSGLRDKRTTGRGVQRGASRFSYLDVSIRFM
jgi:hypothetical protein